jgi:hypothetical protein
MKLEFFRQILEKYSNIKFRENSSNSMRAGGLERHNESNGRFSQLYQSSQKRRQCVS